MTFYNIILITLYCSIAISVFEKDYIMYILDVISRKINQQNIRDVQYA